MEILHSYHCELCDHQRVSLKEGSTCILTEKKPAFNRTCSKIQLTNKFEEKVKQVNVEYQHALKDKWLTYTYTIVFMLLSATVFLGLYNFNNRLAEILEGSNSSRGQGMLIVVYIFVATAGLILFGMAIGAFNKYQSKVSSAARKKKKIDDVLALYEINYSIDISFGRKYHGTQEVAVDFQRKIF